MSTNGRHESSGRSGGEYADSFGGVTLASAPCARCGAAIAVAGGGCLKCLLRAALEENPESEHCDSLEAVLTEIDVRDQDWQLGNYHILEEIGRGGMGVIYRARQRHSKRIVALKRVLSYHSDSRETLERFRREAEAAASLDHPNILPIYEVGEADGLPFFTMKLATGGSLQRAAAGLSAQPRECVRLVAKVARAVACAHRQGILHRDLKPGNILLDSSGEPLVSDFGLAKWVDANTDLTRSLAIFGTPGFVAPEQARGVVALTPAADVYSLGAILFDLLTGRPPFLGEHALAVIHEAAEKPAPRLRSINSSLDRDVETICAKCLERDPQARYRAAADLAEDLECWLDGRPIVARPVHPVGRVWRWSKRNPVLAAAAAALVLTAAAAVTRQLQSWRLQSEVDTRWAAQRSVEVLPLLNLDTGRRSEEWTQRVAAELRQHLHALGPATITVANATPISATATPTSREAAVPARSLLGGTVRKVGGRVRVALHLVDAQSRQPLLHRMIEVAGENEVAGQALAGQMYGLLSVENLGKVAQRPSDPGLLDPEAKKFIDSGLELAYRGGRELDRAISCLRHAVELQPKSSAGHAALSKALSFKMGFQSTREPLQEALEVGHKALELNPNNAQAHLAMGAVKFHGQDLQGSLEHTLAALEHDPFTTQPAGLVINIHKATGRPDLALAWNRIWDDGSEFRRHAVVADIQAQLHNDSEAETAYQRYLKLHPEQPTGWIGLSRLRMLSGSIDEARSIYQQHWNRYRDFNYAAQIAAQVEFFGRNFAEAERIYGELYERDPRGGTTFYGSIPYATALGRIRVERDRSGGEQLLHAARAATLENVSEDRAPADSLYRVAAIDASLDNRGSALAHLGRAFERGWIDFRSLELDPRFDRIRQEPAYGEVVDKMKNRVAELRANVQLEAK